MGDAIKKGIFLLFEHKWKLVLMLISTLFFAALLFPFGDLGDLVSSQVSKLTNNRLYLQFDQLRLSLFPAAGVALDEVYLEAQNFPALKSQQLIFTPSISSLISQKPAGSVVLKGFLQGTVEASLKPAKKSENDVPRQALTLNAKKISLNDLRELVELPVMIKGQLDIESKAIADLSFQEAPDMDLTIKIEKFELPAANVQTQMGPLTLPNLKLSSVELKGRLSAGRFQIESGIIGRDADEVKGTIKGGMSMTIQNHNGQIVPIWGAYAFEVDLSIRKSFQDRAALFLSFIDQHKTPLADGARYAFKLSATDPQNPPNITALH